MKPIILLVAILIALSSCKKGVSGTSPTPPAKDTSYLRKTEIVYSYDLSGNKLPDSTITKWAYDLKGRVIFQCDNYNKGSETDTFNTSYGSGQITYDGVDYRNGVLSSKTHRVDYYNSNGLSDSSVISSSSFTVNNGNPIVFNNTITSVVAYFFDSYGNDTLDIYSSITNNVKSVTSISRKTYVNNVLSSSVSYTPGWVKVQSSQWDAGSLISEIEYNSDGSVEATYNYSYTNTPAGGFYGYTGGKDLEATELETGIFAPGGNLTETFSYSFDSFNRVNSMLQKFSTAYGNIQSFYTYY
jgi:hypothetical protein